MDANIDETHSKALVDSRVQHAISNLSTNYAADIIPSESLPDNIKQGTSANETWHKHLAKNFVQDSGSISMELAEIVISHLQYLFNKNIYNKNSYKCLTSNIRLQSIPISKESVEWHLNLLFK